MSAKPPQADPDTDTRPFRARRLWLVAAVVVLIFAVYATGLHRHLTLETLVRNRAAIDAFIGEHYLVALAIFIALYFAVVALSVPAAFLLTVSSGVLFGVVVGPLASITGATAGATVVYLIAKTAIGEHLVRRAGPLADKIAKGFRDDAFNYLLFLRLVPAFPFWLVNLVPALVGVKISVFVAATALGIMPGAFAFGFVGAGLGSVIQAQERSYNECMAAGRDGCRLNFDIGDAATPELLAALAALGVVALIPILVRRLRARRHAAS